MRIDGSGATQGLVIRTNNQPTACTTFSASLKIIQNQSSPNWRQLREFVNPSSVGLKFDRQSYGFESLTTNKLSGVERTVKYTGSSDREKSACVIAGGKIHLAGEPINPQRNFSTSSKTWFRAQDRFAYVLARPNPGEKPQLFVFKHVEGEIHHTSPVAAHNVLDAGFMSVRNGNVSYIENRSGHYKPAIESKLHTLAALKDGGADLKTIFVSERVEQRDMFGNSLVADEESIDLALSNKHPLYSAADAFERRSFADSPRIQSSNGEYDLADKTRITWR